MSAHLHIHIDFEEMQRMVDKAIESLPAQVEKPVVPAGYHCAECYASDGGHNAGCSAYGGTGQ